MFSIFLQLLINGIIAGAIYALVASGFALIYSTNKFVHFAHGGVIALSAYFLYWLFSMLHFNFYFTILATIFFASLLGYTLNKFFYRPLRKRKSSASILLVASIAILILLESLALLIFGANVKALDFIAASQSFSIFDAIITPVQVIIVSLSFILLLALFILMKKTRIGKAMRAVADNKEVAEIVGISSEKIYTWSFVIGSAIAGAAAVLISLEQNIQPTMGTNLMIKGFTGAIIGGVGSVPGAILGSFLLGLIENFGIWFLPSGYKDAIAFILLFIFLLFRPQGILGIKNNQK
jgi:branched-chain amino acid transport system permease protein